LYHDCDHAGVWIVDFQIAQIFIGEDATVNEKEALKLFNKDEKKIVVFDSGQKWFLPSFIEFQYGVLNESNRAHNSVLTILKKYNLIKYVKTLSSPLQGGKDMDKDKDKVKDKDYIGKLLNEFCEAYQENHGIDYEVITPGKERAAIAKLLKLYKDKYPEATSEETLAGLRSYFNAVVSVPDDWLSKNMSPSIIVNKFNEINNHLKNAKNRGNSKGATDRELAELVAKHFGEE